MYSKNNLVSRLNKRVIIEENSAIPDGSGGFVSNWVEFKTVWAEIKPVKYEEKFEAGQITNEASHSIIIRYIAELNPSMRIKYSDRIFEIVSIINDMEENKFITISAKENI